MRHCKDMENENCEYNTSSDRALGESHKIIWKMDKKARVIPDSEMMQQPCLLETARILRKVLI